LEDQLLAVRREISFGIFTGERQLFDVAEMLFLRQREIGCLRLRATI
jgi:hypothetical protein